VFTNPVSFPKLQDLRSEDVIVSTGDAPRNINYFHSFKNKIIIHSHLGDFFRDEQIAEILDTNTGNNFFIFIIPHNINQSFFEKYEKTARFILFKNAYAEYSWLVSCDTINFEQIKQSKKTKHFLSLNNRASWFRQGLFYFFKNFNLDNLAYLSYLGDLNRSTYSTLDEIDVEFHNGVDQKVWYAENIDFTEIKKQIPYYSLEKPSDIDWGIGDQRYYNDSFCSIVTETYSWEDIPFFTEKTFKPIMFYQPFLLHSNPNSFDYLRDLGFKTFEKWIDQSYDQYIGRKRFEAMLRVILDMSSWSLEKINDIYLDMLPILEYNHNHLMSTFVEQYDNDIDKIKQDIRVIIKDHS
jgi:hypothetical protein